MSRRDAGPLIALGFIAVVTGLWWTLALWSVPGAPEWLERTRAVCFNLTETGLPDAKGWLLLFGQPPLMLVLLLVVWGRDVAATMRSVVSSRYGRLAVLGSLTLVLAGATAAVVRVRGAQLPPIEVGSDAPAPSTYPRLDRDWPGTTGLVDQAGLPFNASSLDRPALVTFAFGHCATICPAVVHQARAARLQSGRDLDIVVFTLDPWRDTPGRLNALIEQFDLDGTRDHMVSGPVDDVNAALDLWMVPRERDLTTGDITHPAIVYLVETDGTIAYGSTGGINQMLSLVERLN